MSAREDGGPAYPAPVDVKTDWSLKDVTSGMTLRDWFAGQALAGMMAQEWGVAVANGLNRFEASYGMTTAGFAYQIADAMIAERSK